MSLLVKKILWYPVTNLNTSLVLDNQYGTPENITDDINWNSGKALDIKNNVLSLTLKNANSFYNESDGRIAFQEQDQIKIYIRYVDDNDDLGTEWESNTNEPSSDYLLGTYYVIELGVNHQTNNTQVKLTCADKTYILFNRVFAKGFTLSEGLTAPEIIQKVIRFAAQSTNGPFYGSGSDSGVKYEVDARTVSEGGYMQDTRNDSSVFPEVAISKVWKPIYEWIKDLSQIEYTNSSTEISTNALVHTRAFIFWIDEENRFHWVYPTDTVDSSVVVGTDKVISLQLTKKVFDVVNMIIFNAGTDMYGTGIWNYEIDTTSSVRTLKMKVLPMVDIAEDLINKDYQVGYTLAASRDAGEGGKGNGYPIPQFPTSYPPSGCYFCQYSDTYPLSANVTTDSKYNDALREAATKIGSGRAQAILDKLANARWVGNIEIIGSNSYNPGNLIQLTDTEVGILNQKIRIMQIQHNITKTGWFTTLTLEEDGKAIE
jgi:hypothetical protein